VTSYGKEKRQAVGIGRSAMQLDEGAFATFPGAAFVVDDRGSARGLNSRGTTIIADTPDSQWRHAGAQIAAIVHRGLAAVEALTLEHVVEAMVLPLGDGSTALVLVRDQGLETNLREALIESRQRFKALVEISSDFAWETDAQGRFTFVSPQGALGWTSAQLLGVSASGFLVDASEAQASVFHTKMPIADMDLWFRRADGGASCLGVAAVPVLGRDGALKGARGVCRDLTADRARDEALARARMRDRLMAHLVRAMRDEIEPHKALAAAVSAAGLAIGALGGTVLRRLSDGSLEVSARWGEAAPPAALVATQDRLVGAVALDFMQDDYCFTGMATRYRGASNGALILWRPASDGAFVEADRTIVADVADRLGIAIAQVVQHERIVQLSRTDGLTGLLNRRAFFEELDRRLSSPDIHRRPGALIYLDLDNFKLVNDNAGHGAGDEVLTSLAGVLRRNTRGSDVAARLGGDEFVVWVNDIAPDKAVARAEALRDLCRSMAPGTGDPTRPLSVSVGLAFYAAESGETPAALVARADRAMYEAKSAGKGLLRLAAQPIFSEEAIPA
jgi:diguanylate cyclase (GGDEF)-like protein/PAS domain S-box-containing protein